MAIQDTLGKLAGQMPIANQRIAQAQAQTRAIQLAQQLKQMQPQQATLETAQQAGQAAGQQQAQDQAQQAQQAQQQAGQLFQQGQQAQQTQNQQVLGQGQVGLQKLTREQNEQLAALDLNARQELFDRQMNFQKNSQNQTVLKERQLADFAALSTNRGESLKGYQQAIQNAMEKRKTLLDLAQRKIQQTLEQGYTGMNQRLNNQQKTELLQYKRAIEKAQADHAASVKNSQMIMGAVGSIIGAYFGPVGSAVGGALGTAAGGAAADGSAESVSRSDYSGTGQY